MHFNSKQLIIIGRTITNHWYPCYQDHLLGKLHCETTQTHAYLSANKKQADQHETMVCQRVLRLTNANKEQVVAMW